ncbi:MAG: sulfatase-like hydrolase/transferase, partial [Planctomycetes bacterium]|nr:sulfatase-like hydrolase/transferase [Planctomycetota bacterium]
MNILKQNTFLFYWIFVTAISANILCAEDNRPVTDKTARPNVLLIGVETLRADHVSSLGYSRVTTPTLDKLAKGGALFSGAIGTSSWTMPTNMSILTSLYPGVHKTTDYQKKLPPGRNTLAGIMKARGYTTAAFVSNPTLGSQYGFSRGFDLYDDFSVELDLGLNLFENNDRGNRQVHNAMTSKAVNRSALSWLRKNYDKPFFMFVFYFDPHYDYIPPPPFDTIFDPNYDGQTDGRGIVNKPRPSPRDLEHIIALYDGEILYTDGYISKLLEKFAEYGIMDNTLVVVFSDHGDEFYEHGSSAHGQSLHNELTHIPLIFKWPGAIAGNKKIDCLVSQVDIMPTILDYMDIQYNGVMQGKSLKGLIEGKEGNPHDIVYGEVSIHKNKFFAAAASKDYKFILDLQTGKKQLFNINDDPDEQIDIYMEK